MASSAELLQRSRDEQAQRVPVTERHAVMCNITDAEHALLREVAWRRRGTQGDVLRRGLVLVAEEVAQQGNTAG
jgi:hypothetical protein